MFNSCAINLEPLDPLADNPLRHYTVPILKRHPSMHFGTWYSFSPQKEGLCPLLFRGANGKRGLQVYSTKLKT